MSCYDMNSYYYTPILINDNTWIFNQIYNNYFILTETYLEYYKEDDINYITKVNLYDDNKYINKNVDLIVDSETLDTNYENLE